MDNRLITALAALLLLPFCLSAAPRHYDLLSPDGRLCVGVDAGPQLTYTLAYDGVPVLAPSQVSVSLDDGSAYDGAAPPWTRPSPRRCTTARRCAIMIMN